MAADLRGGIIKGDYAVGDILPTIAELAANYGVSANVPRRALGKLQEEGLVRPRRGVGSVVIDKGADLDCLGRVLCFGPFISGGPYFGNLVESLRSRLIRNRARLEIVNDPGGELKSRYAELQEMLKRRWELVLFWDDARARHLIASSGSPFVIIGDHPHSLPEEPGFRGVVDIRNTRAVGELVRACVRAGVRRILRFSLVSERYDAAEYFRTAEIELKTVKIATAPDAEGNIRAGMKAMNAVLASGRQLPDLIYFTEDFPAQGALMALAAAGVKIPEMVRFVSLSNKGIGPVWIKPLARLESDPFSQGAEIAKAVIEFLKHGEFPSPLELGTEWKSGESF